LTVKALRVVREADVIIYDRLVNADILKEAKDGWNGTDAEARKRGEQTGLDTLVVHALNDGY